MEWFRLSLMIDRSEATIGATRRRPVAVAEFRAAFDAAAPRLTHAARVWLQRLCLHHDRVDLLDVILARRHRPAPWETFQSRTLAARTIL